MAVVQVEEFCSHGGWIRVWRNNEGPPAKYTYHIGYKVRVPFATLKGFNEPNVPHSEFEQVIRAVNNKLGLLVEYDRFHRLPHMKSVQIDPRLTGGRILMSKIAIPHTDEAKTEDGSIDHTLMGHHIEVVREAVHRGQLKMITMGQVTVENEQDLPDLDDVLNNDQLLPGDKIYVFCAREIEVGPGGKHGGPGK